MKKFVKISRSKIELFLECPRCFWLDVKHNIKRPEGKRTAYIGAKYDPLLKKNFDELRIKKEIPEEFKDLKYNFRLFDDFKKIKNWRDKGVEFFHPEHNLIYYGKIDDLLLLDEKYLVPFDYKTTLSKDFQIYDSYKNQLEIYGYLLQKAKEKVTNIGVFYVVKIEIQDNFEKIESRELVVVENLNYDFYDEVLEKLKEVYYSNQEPEPNINCEFCQRDNFVRNMKND